MEEEIECELEKHRTIQKKEKPVSKPVVPINEFFEKNMKFAIELFKSKYKSRDIRKMTGVDLQTVKKYINLNGEKNTFSQCPKGRPAKFLPEYNEFISSFLEEKRGKFITSIDVKRELCKKFNLADNFATRFTIRL